MNLQPYSDRLHTVIQDRVGRMLSADAANMLKLQLKRILTDGIAEAMQERPYLLRAHELKKLGAEIPDTIPDNAFVPCFPPVVSADPTQQKPDELRLRIELSYLMSADVPITFETTVPPDAVPQDTPAPSE
jgi:hypothetical protein